MRRLTLEESSYQAGDIQDQRNRAVAVNRRAGKTGHLLEIGLQALYHHLLLREQLIDEHGDAPAVRLQHDQQSVGNVAAVRLDAEQIMESDYRQVVGAVFEEFGAARDAAQIFPRRLDRFDDGHERSNVDLFPYPQDLT